MAVRRAIISLVVLASYLTWEAHVSRMSAECVSHGEPTMTKRLAASQLVFLGDVLSIENVITAESVRYKVRFRIIEAFKGASPMERSVQFRQSAEAFRFEVPQRVLVYAHGVRDNYSTECTATRVVGVEDAEVLALRRLTRK